MELLELESTVYSDQLESCDDMVNSFCIIQYISVYMAVHEFFQVQGKWEGHRLRVGNIHVTLQYTK